MTIVIAVVCMAAWGLATVSADGLLPGLPYHYLNPPPALRRGNKRPLSGVRVLPASYMRAVQDWSIFTQDGQAGVAGSKGALRFDRSASAVVIRIDPVPYSGGLPAQIAPNGNAYRVSITEQPSGAAVAVVQPITVTLRWPHIPVAMYTERSGRWQQLCYSNQALITGQTMTCRTSHLGTFLAVAIAAGGGGTPVSATPSSGSSVRWIPLIAVGAVVVLAALGALLITRPWRSRGSG